MALSVDQAKAERARFARARQEGALVTESDAVIERTYGEVRALQGVAPRLPTLLTRNLLLGLGWRAAMRRLGDTNVRMDIVAGHDGRLCAVEVEFSDAVVDAPRNVLDDLAVLVARYDREKASVMGVVVALSLPNQRSEYWLVMENIAEVLQVRVGTVTIGALLLLLWNRRQLGAEPPSAIAGSHSIRASAEAILGRRARLTLGCESVLESAK